jgi:NAD(P)-dependent dehydrogenase (short-subunit alcohol dehydrogenase family)
MSVILIVGGSSGIGKALAQQLAAEGNKVFATYNKNNQPGTDNISYHHLDVMNPNIDLKFLPDAIDGLVYCPGTINLRPFNRINAPDLLQEFEINVTGAVKVLQAALPKLKNSSSASVVLFSTVAVQVGLPFHAAVSSAKGAVEGLTKALAAEWAPRIRVNCIAPSLTDTPLATALLSTPEKREAAAQRHPLKRIATPQDIAATAAFLLSDKAACITGQIIPVDGGLSTLKV